MFLRRRAAAGAALLALGIVASLAGGDDRSTKGEPPICGRWDLTVQGSQGDYPSWLEVRLSGRTTLVGSFVGRFGSARPISRVEFADGRVHFGVPPQWESRKDDLDFEGKLEGDAIRGETTDDDGKRVAWTAAGARRWRGRSRRPGASRWSCSTGRTWPGGSRDPPTSRADGKCGTACW